MMDFIVNNDDFCPKVDVVLIYPGTKRPRFSGKSSRIAAVSVVKLMNLHQQMDVHYCYSYFHRCCYHDYYYYSGFCSARRSGTSLRLRWSAINPNPKNKIKNKPLPGSGSKKRKHAGEDQSEGAILCEKHDGFSTDWKWWNMMDFLLKMMDNYEFCTENDEQWWIFYWKWWTNDGFCTENADSTVAAAAEVAAEWQRRGEASGAI